MYIYFGSSIEGTIVLLVISVALTALVMGILGLNFFILRTIKKIKDQFKK